AKITFANGRVMEGDELNEAVEGLRQTAGRIRRLASVVPAELLEQAAIAGALTLDPIKADAAAQVLAQRLDAVSLPTERGWKVSAGSTLTMGRTVRGVAERHTLDAAGLRNGDARWLDE